MNSSLGRKLFRLENWRGIAKSILYRKNIITKSLRFCATKRYYFLENDISLEKNHVHIYNIMLAVEYMRSLLQEVLCIFT